MSGNPRSDFVLAVDLDGVCGDYEAVFRSVVAEELGVEPGTIGLQDHWEFAQSADWPITSRDQYVDLHRVAVTEKGMFRTMPVIPGAPEALQRLSDAGVWIRIVSHRLCVNFAHAITASDTVNWLDDNKLPYRDLCLIGDKAAVGADLYIDDSPSQITGLREKGVDVLVFDHLYNRHIEGPRARDWAEVENYVLARLEEHLSVSTTGPPPPRDCEVPASPRASGRRGGLPEVLAELEALVATISRPHPAEARLQRALDLLAAIANR